MSRIEYWQQIADEAEEWSALRRAALLMVRVYKKWGNENVNQ